MTEWRKITNLKKHKALTITVRSKLRKVKYDLEKKMILLNLLLEKPIMEDKHGPNTKGRNRGSDSSDARIGKIKA